MLNEQEVAITFPDYTISILLKDQMHNKISWQGLLESKKNIKGNHAFLRDGLATTILKSAKIQNNVCIFFPN